MCPLRARHPCCNIPHRTERKAARMIRHLILGATILAATCACTLLTQDQRFGGEIIGSWIVAGDSADYVPVPMHERFYRDGTYRIFWFSDATCSHVIGETHLTWRIENGALVSRITAVTNDSYGRVGDVMRAQIVSLTNRKMVLRSVDDGETYIRVRSTRCLAPRAWLI